MNTTAFTKPPSTPGMPKSWQNLNITGLKAINNQETSKNSTIIHLEDEKIEKRKKVSLDSYKKLSNPIDQLSDDLEQSSNDFSINKVYSFIQSSSNISFQQTPGTISSNSSPTKFIFTSNGKSKSKEDSKIFSYFQFQNKNKLENIQAIKKLMRLNLSPNKFSRLSKRITPPPAPHASSFSKFDQEVSFNELRINHFFPRLSFAKPQNDKSEVKARAAVNESKMFNNSASNNTLANFEDISLIYLKQNEIEKEDNKKSLQELNDESVFTDTKNLIEPPPILLSKRKNGTKSLVEPQTHSSLVSLSQLPATSMSNLLTSSTSSIIANRKLPSVQMVNFTTEHEKKSFNRYVSSLNLIEEQNKNTSVVSNPTQSIPPELTQVKPIVNPSLSKKTVTITASTTTTANSKIISEKLDFEDNFYKSTFLITDDKIVEQQLNYVPTIPKSSIKKRVHFFHGTLQS